MSLLSSAQMETPSRDEARAQSFFRHAATSQGAYRVSLQGQGLAQDPYNAVQMKVFLDFLQQHRNERDLPQLMKEVVNAKPNLSKFFTAIIEGVIGRDRQAQSIQAVEFAVQGELGKSAEVLAEHAARVLRESDSQSSTLKRDALRLASVCETLKLTELAGEVIGHARKIFGVGADTEIEDRVRHVDTLKVVDRGVKRLSTPEPELDEATLPAVDAVEAARLNFEKDPSSANTLLYVTELLTLGDRAEAQNILRKTYRQTQDASLQNKLREIVLEPEWQAYVKAKQESNRYGGESQTAKKVVSEAYHAYASAEFQFYTEWLREFPASADARLGVARGYLRSKKPDEAIKYLQEARTQAKPELMNEINHEMAQAFLVMRSFTEAISLCEDLLGSLRPGENDRGKFKLKVQLTLARSFIGRAEARSDLSDGVQAEKVLAQIRVQNIGYEGSAELKERVEKFLSKHFRSGDEEGAAAEA